MKVFPRYKRKPTRSEEKKEEVEEEECGNHRKLLKKEESGIHRKLLKNQSMSPVFSIAFQEYIDPHCT